MSQATMPIGTAPATVIGLRDYQRAAIDAVHERRAAGVTRQLISLPTGAGKTYVAAHLVAEIGLPTVFMVHRDELVQQTLRQMRQVNPGLSLGVCKAEQNDVGADIIIASAQTIARQPRLDRLRRAVGPGALFISDECHHDAAETRQRAIREMEPALLVGLTATPLRGDKVGLDMVYDEIVYHLPMLDLIANNMLARLTGLRIDTETELDAVHTRAGEFAEDELANAVDTPERNELIVQSWRKHASDRKRTVAFCVNRKHALDLRDAFRAAGIGAEMVLGETPPDERARIFAEFHAGRLPVITNCMVLTEGYDEPAIDCILMTRPTKSQGLFIQCLDLETEVLTARGWQTHSTIQATDLVAGVEVGTNRTKWLPILSTVRRPVRPGERMVTLRNPSLDIRVTEGHRMVVSRKGKSGIEEAGDLVGSGPHRIPVSAVGNEVDCELTDEECRFLGWFHSDGNLNPLNNAVTISQAVHQPQIEDLRRTLRACGFRFGDNTRPHPDRPETQMTFFTISRGAPRGPGVEGLRGWGDLQEWLTPERALTPAYERLSARQFELFMEGLHLGNGSKQRNQEWTPRSYHISFGDATRAGHFQSLASRRGWRAHLSSWKPSAGSWGTRDVVVMHAKKIQDAHLDGRPSDGRPTWQFSEAVLGEEVWCVENELGTLISRRNGKVTVLGNCVGRGARKSPGKADCLVIDFVDLTSRHKLVGFPSLLGELDEVPEGSSSAAPEPLAQGELVDLLELAQKRAKVRERAAVFVNLFGASPFVWRDVRGQFMSKTSRGEWLTLFEEDDGFVPVLITPGNQPTVTRLFDRPVDSETAMAIAESKIEVSPLTDRNARWRNAPERATEGQMKAARAWKVALPPNCTKGQASELIDAAVFASVMRKITGRAG